MLLSAPSPCERRYRLRVLRADLTSHWPSVPFFRSGGPTSAFCDLTRGAGGISQVLVRFSSYIPRSKVDPGRPSESLPKRSLCVGFPSVNTVAICINLILEAVSSLGDCGFPCGLQDSLCTLQRFRSVNFVDLLDRCNTRYKWLVTPYLIGTFTRREAPSFAWRTNGRR
jgi:hypothetical protein